VERKFFVTWLSFHGIDDGGGRHWDEEKGGNMQPDTVNIVFIPGF
jgi:hypothetical protein